jgi:hypothetical protein
MPASRSVVSMLLKELGDFSLHPQGRPCGRPAAALRPGNDTTVTGIRSHPPPLLIPDRFSDADVFDWRVTIDDKVPMRRTTMALEKGDRVIFTKDAGGILRPFVRKGTEGTVTKAGGWGSDTEVTLENGTKLTVSQDEVSKIGGKSGWW